MIFYYVRHGHPTYNPNALTPLGWREAEAIGKRLAFFGVDEIYASVSNRAMETAKPTCEMTGKPLTTLEFADEQLVFQDMIMNLENGKKTWVFSHPEGRRLFADPEVLALGHEWHTHPAFAGHTYKEGLERIRTESDKFFASLGYEHIPGTGTFKAVAPNDKRVALFAHQGFGLAFLSCLLDIPYPQFSLHFDLSHSSLTVIEFTNENGISVPRVSTLSSDAHLYKEGLPTQYNGRFRF